MDKKFLIPVLLAAMLWFMAGGAFAAGVAGLPKEILAEVKDLKELPKGTYTKIKFYEAELLSHGPNTGSEKQDVQASGKKCWASVSGKHVEGHAIYGPYEELEEGRYVAFFRIKLLQDAGDEPVMALDACVEYGQNVLAQREVMGEDLLKDRFVQIPLLFEYSGGDLETRVFWHGFYSFAIDSITIFKIKKK